MVNKVLASFNIQAAQGVFIISAAELEGLHVPSFPPTMDVVLLDTVNMAHLGHVLLANYLKTQVIHVLQQGSVQEVLLENLANIPKADAVYIPARSEVLFAEDFQEVIAHLRAPDGCPWDREQTHESLKVFILEEVYELLDAIDEKNFQEIAEELGDVLLQLYLHSQIAAENDEFRLVDVFTAISTKMRRRHPHVFSDVDVKGSVGKVLTNWQDIKAEERKANGIEKTKGVLDGVSNSLPALLQAQHYQQRAILNGFNWDSKEGAFNKVREEVEEVLGAEDDQELGEEYGDLLFSLVSAISYAGLEAEVVLRAANQKFYQRYTKMETILRENGGAMREMSEDEKIKLWESVK